LGGVCVERAVPVQLQKGDLLHQFTILGRGRCYV